MNNTWDVVKPLDNWERYFCHLSYLHVGLKMVGATKIVVKHVSV